MVGHPKRRKNNNDDTDGYTDESESAVTALAQNGRLRRCMILQLL